MGKSESFYFPEDESRPARHVSQSGCFVKLTTGFILLLLAILIAVGVGLIVHFAEKKNDSCDLHSNNQGSSNAQTGSGSGGDVIITVPTTTSTTTTTKKVSTAKTTVKPTAATTLTTTAATAGPTTPSQPQFHRLPTDVIPLQYDLNIEPHMYSGDPSSFTFDGTVKIRLQCKKASKIIYLNYKEMTIQENSIKISSVDPAEKTTIQHLKLSPEEQLITIETANPLTVGKEYIVEMSYSGPLQKDLKGFYLSSYQDEGFTRYLATTQFQPTDARKAFPCMDEPNFKAVFKMSIVRPKGWTSLANAALETTNDLGNGRYEDVFEPTLKMSTYLVAFVISQFDHKNDTTKDGILYRVWSRPNAIEETNEALGLGTDILTFYENLFKVKFPLKKQDMIAIPDYPLGAMENWGLVTYRETAMLYDPKLSPASQRQVVTTDIAHELSHMWFGDLVTMSWWDDLWLNEGFATFIQYIGVDHAHPDWNMIEQFITKTVHVAMAFDSYKSSHPIYVPVNSPDEIGEIFDKISYSKGGSVIKMAENFLGKDTFFKGLSEYLKNLAYGSSTHDDLFRYLNEQATKDGVHLPNSLTVADIMNTWILQMNYPVVTFTRQQDKVTVSQKRFLVNGDAIANEKYASPYNYSWIVPVTMTWKDNPVTPKVSWLLNENKELEGSVPKDSPWILGNVDEVGYYRVNYDPENWNALIQQLSEDRTKISQRNRAQIVNDAWNLAKADMLDLDIALRSVEYLSKETNYVPWAAAITELNYLDLMLSSSELYGKLEEFMRKITTNEYKRLGMESADSSHIDRLTRSAIVSVACGYGLEECVTDAQQLFKKMMETGDQSVIPVDVKRTVYCTAISHGGWEEWEYTLNQMMTSTVAAEVSLLQGALSCSSQTWILSYYLQLSLNDSVIRSQDTIRVIEDVSQNPVGRLMAWQFVQDEWDYLRNKYGGAWFNFGDLIKTVTNTFNTQAHVEELQNFIRDHPNLGTAQRAFEQAIEQVQNNMMFMQVNEEIIRKWLQKTSVGTEAEAIDVRLPRDVIPSLYELEIQPDIYQDNPDNFSFSGHVKIHVECVAATSVIKFHTVDLSIDQSSVRVIHANAVPSSGEVPVASISYDAKRQFTILNLGQPLEASQGYTLEMSYKGPLRSDKMAGLYTSSYMRNGQPVYLATTQMEPTDARRAFPCFDEPAMKAKFKLTIVRKSSKLSVSNMPKLSQETRKDGWIADVFATSQTMSTYLVALVVCDFVNRTGITTNNITYGAWSRPEVHDQTELALDVGVDTLTFYEDFFGVKFPLPKQDMIAVPDFSAGAMENWGLITYRENSMLYKVGVSSTADKQWTTETITHELAHQWFGDLVTMSWWDDLWLNEGFATFVQYLGTDNKFPSWNMFEQFTVKVLQPAFDFDSLTSSHPIYVPVKNPDEINEIFDSISYDKGASIIRMMRHFIGEETFKQGLKNYLEDRKFSNAFHDDLWYALGNQTVADGHMIDVKQIMDTWTLQMNYPVVMVKRVSSSTLHVQQKRYLRDYSAPESTKYTSPFNYHWIVPLTFTTAASPDFDQDYSKVQMLQSSETNVHVANDAKDWILCNVKQNGFYRVNYDESNWNLLLQQLKTNHEVIHPINRAQIINDAWALIKAGDLDIMFGLKSFEYLGKEMSYVPWFAANGELSYVKRMLSRSPVYGDLQSFLRNIVKEPFNALEKGGKSLGHIEKLARAKVTSIACANHLPECETMAMEEFQKWQSDPDTYRIDPDVKEFLMCSAISQGGVAEWDFLFERFQKSDVANERRMIMSALACTGEPWVLQRYLGYALDDTKIKSQDASYPLRYASTNSIGREIVWNFIKDNWMVLLNRYGGGSFTMSNILTSATSSFNTPSELQMMKEFKGQHPNMGSGTRAFEQAIEKTQSNIQWMTDNYHIIKSWLQTVVTPDKGNNQVLTDVRLPRSVLPDLYQLELFPDIYGPDPENFTFSGHVTITVNCTGTTDKIIMHSNKLTIDRGSVSVQEVGAQGSGNVQVTRLSHDLDRQFVILQLGSNLTQGKQYKVYMEFMSPLKNDLAGVYLSSYMRQNKTVYLATTQMEPTDARKTFPCFDEPDMKAKFQLNIVRKNSRISVSNMPLVRQETRGNELIADVFATSQTMSTYLVAFVVCDFVNRTGITTNNITYGAWSRPEVHDQTELALDVGVDTLTFYEDFFGVKFPLPKQDMIAVPDFSAGAMENWGLITYRENSMLYKEGVSSTADKQWTTETITHELAHQWFGDLVTMSWWDDLWLNEGFATFVQYLGTDNKFPSWNMFEQFTVKVLQPAFDFDSLTSSHPIYVPVKNPDEINEIFDSISYDKGASIIRMMRHFIGEETFKQGLKNYLEDRKFSNAFHDDLWYALGNQTVADGHTIDVKQIMDTWTLQMNYPVVMVKRVSSSTLRVQQKRYLRDYSAPESTKYTSPFNYQWIVPLTFTTAASPDFDQDYSKVQMLRSSEMSVYVANDAKDWILCNVKQNGFYRVNYDESNWNLLLQQLKTDHKVIDPINRAQLINDAWALVKSGDLAIKFGLKSLEYLGKEMSYVPWFAANGELSYVKRMLSRSPVYGDLQTFLRSIVKEPFNALQKEGTSSGHIDKLARSKITSIACANHLPECETMAMEEFQKWQSDPDTYRIDPDLKEFLMCSAISQGGVAEWDFLFERFQKSDVANERRMIMSALACTGEPWVLQRYLGYALDDTKIKSQDASYPLRYASTNSIGREIVWNFIKDNWMVLLNRYGGGSFTMSNILTSATSSFNTPSELQMMKEFKGQHPNMGSGTRAFEQAMEKTQSNIQWMTDNYNTIESWLQTVVTPDKGNNQVLTDVRLPRSVLPDLYQLELSPDIYGPDPENFTFSGHVTITVNCTDTTDKIIMHSNKLTIDRGSVSVQEVGAQGSGNVQVTSLSYDLDRQFVILQLGSNLTQGKQYTVYMKFMGPLKDDLTGLYLSSYKRGNHTVYLATTQMEATEARKAFPCFDEPDMKAMFEVTIIRSPSKKSVSNMPLLKTTTRPNGMVADEFDRSVRMSSYLVAFIVHDFDRREDMTKNGVKYGVLARRESMNQTALALHVGVKTLEYYEEFFGIRFPLPKQDMIAIPDFDAGAMENWGLITYRETAMLFKEGVSSAGNKERVTTVVTHELAHQWFGDLVTMGWWDDLWLNEGFASYVEYLGADHVFPELEIFERFTYNEIQRAMAKDGLVTSHPIYARVYNPDQINEIFDSISYSKGATIIRMMRFFVGDAAFKNGLNRYLTSRMYGNSFHDDLWFAMGNETEAEGQTINVKDIMDTWTLQMGFPVLNVSRLPDGSIRVSQKRFLQNYKAVDPMKYVSPFNYIWKVPLTFTSEPEQKFQQNYRDITWLDGTEQVLDNQRAKATRSSKWILFNTLQMGYYRVNYDRDNWLQLIYQLNTNHTAIPAINRGQIINDAWAISRSGELDIEIPLRTSEYLANEMDYVPWVTSISELAYVRSMLSKTEHFGKFRTFMANLVKAPFKKFGFNIEKASHMESYLISDIVSLACYYGIGDCVTQAEKLFQQWMDNPDDNPVHPDLKSTIYCTAVREGGDKEWDFLYQQYNLVDVAAEQRRILSALGCTRKPWILNTYLQMSLQKDKVKKQDSSYVISYVGSNPIGGELAWKFFTTRWPEIRDMFAGSFFSMRTIVEGVTSGMNTQTDLEQLEDFKRIHSDLGAGTTVFNEAIERTKSNIQWMQTNYLTVASWLDRTLNAQTGTGSQGVKFHRLPRHILPRAYELEILPDIYKTDPSNFRFFGQVAIHLNCVEAGDNITLNSNISHIDGVQVTHGGQVIQVKDVKRDDDQQLLVVMLSSSLVAGENYTLKINYTGPLTNDLNGLYYSSYTENGTIMYMASTHFEPVRARKMLPCFDEPDLKATFAVTVVRRDPFIALSNMPLLKSEKRSSGLISDTFKTSPIMSTYLLAIAVCQFAYREQNTSHGIQYRAWAVPYAVDQTKLALEVGVKTITFYEDFFNISFPLPKQDMIAIPNFAPGAMENWGLITYRETAMLFDPLRASASNKQRVTTVVTHELAHQWFGNLVTMKWWDDLWLNEGFASFVEYLGADNAFPDWHYMENFVVNDLFVAMAYDEHVNSHPIFVPVASPSEIGDVFDDISYSKGGSVLRMIQFFLGKQTFQRGLTRYLNNHRYGNADHNDLWTALKEQSRVDGSNIDVNAVMDTWVLQMNFPVVTIRRSRVREFNVKQDRFLMNPAASDPMKYVSKFGYKWIIPVTIATEASPNFNQQSNNIMWLNSSQSDLMLPQDIQDNNNGWFIANIQQYGFYRVNYDISNWHKIIEQLKNNHTVIHTLNRAQVINDAWSISRSGNLNLSIALSAIDYLSNENTYVVWATAFRHLQYVDHMLEKTDLYGMFMSVMADMLTPAFRSVGLESSVTDSQGDRLLRSLLSENACRYGLQSCVNNATSLFKGLPSQSIDPDIKETVYCTGIAHGTSDQWESLLQMLKATTDSAEKLRILRSLACSQVPWILNRLLTLTLDNDVVPKQEVTKVIVAVSKNPVGQNLAWEFLIANKERTQDVWKGILHFDRMVQDVSKSFNTPYELQQLKDVIEAEGEEAQESRAYQQALEQTQINIDWMTSNRDTLRQWLESKTGLPSRSP